MTNPSQAKKPAVDPREAGRRGGIASGEARRKRRSRSFMDALKARVNSDPDALAEGLLSSAAGQVVAAQLLQKAGSLDADKGGTIVVHSSFPDGGGMQAIVALAYSSGSASIMGLPVTHDELERLLATADGGRGEGVREESSQSRSGRRPVTSTSVSGPPSSDSHSRGPHSPPEENQPVYDATARMLEEYRRQRADLGLEPNDGNNDRPPRPDRWAEV